jgi:hypothetical protein
VRPPGATGVPAEVDLAVAIEEQQCPGLQHERRVPVVSVPVGPARHRSRLRPGPPTVTGDPYPRSTGGRTRWCFVGVQQYAGAGVQEVAPGPWQGRRWLSGSSRIAVTSATRSGALSGSVMVLVRNRRRIRSRVFRRRQRFRAWLTATRRIHACTASIPVVRNAGSHEQRQSEGPGGCPRAANRPARRLGFSHPDQSREVGTINVRNGRALPPITASS